MPRPPRVDARPDVMPADGYVLVRADYWNALLSEVATTMRLLAVLPEAQKRERDATVAELTKYVKASYLIQRERAPRG